MIVYPDAIPTIRNQSLPINELEIDSSSVPACPAPLSETAITMDLCFIFNRA